jgi:cellulose synthase/poly-beta-1,6-N-acetylglucosamine synthase-like glycosyltransferase
VDVSKRETKRVPYRLLHVILFLPFVLALVSWISFPLLANWLSATLFGHYASENRVNWLWQAAVTLFYSWFTFKAIGVGGLLSIGAWLSRKKEATRRADFYPLVSFVVPAFNEQKHLSKCIDSLFRSKLKYPGPIEVIVVDDGSVDATYEVAHSRIKWNSRKFPNVRGRVVRHMCNLGKVEALRSGVNRALGQLVAVVDADSWWAKDALQGLVEYMLANEKVAVTGYVHPIAEKAPVSSLVILQQLEYSQGLGVFRCAQTLCDSVTVVPGAIGLFEASALRSILNSKCLLSVTEDSEITLELQKKRLSVGYFSTASSATIAPKELGSFWNQRMRWFLGWLHNSLGLHRDLLLNRRWLSLVLWYCLAFEYLGAFVELGAIFCFPILFWFAPDGILFVLNLLWFGGYALIVGLAAQAIALRFAYGGSSKGLLLYFAPFYSILWIVNLWARLVSVVKYALGGRGQWRS